MRQPGAERHWQRLSRAAQEEVDRLMRSLPQPVREKAGTIPVVLERVPSEAILADGFEPDLLGLFVGEAFPDGVRGSDPLPAQILLFLENLWEFADHDTEIYREEVRRTYLHELGHYLGLDEDDLFDRDLD